MFSASVIFLSLLGKFEPMFSHAAYMEEVLLLPGDDEAIAGGSEENANRKTMSDLLSLNPHENNVSGFSS
jgi:hypothetical protein